MDHGANPECERGLRYDLVPPSFVGGWSLVTIRDDLPSYSMRHYLKYFQI